MSNTDGRRTLKRVFGWVGLFGVIVPDWQQFAGMAIRMAIDLGLNKVSAFMKPPTDLVRTWKSITALVGSELWSKTCFGRCS